MTKVCHMTSAHRNDDTRIFHKQCVSLASAGYDIYLVAQGGSFEKKGVKISGIPKVSGGRIKRMTKGAKAVYIKALEIDADIYQIHDPELLPYALKLKKKGKIVIFDSHEDFIEILHEKRYIPSLLKPLFGFVFKKYYALVIKKCDAIITVTPHILDKFKKLNNNAYMITNYPIIGDVNEEKAYAASKNIIFAGGITEQWCHHLVIEAVEKCSNEVKYVLVGRSDDKYMMKLKEMQKWNAVVFQGSIPFTDVSKKLCEASVGMAILKYNRNTCGSLGSLGNTKVFEYMSEALPVICTDFVLWKSIVERYNCGICVNPYDADEIAEAIDYLLDNPEIARTMGQNGRRAVIEEFNWGIEERKLIDLYKQLI